MRWLKGLKDEDSRNSSNTEVFLFHRELHFKKFDALAELTSTERREGEEPGPADKEISKAK